MPGLAFVFFTPALHVVPTVTLRQHSIPGGLQVTKYFYRPEVESIKEAFQEIRSLGPGAAEEWLKGLYTAGQDKMTDAARFEQYDAVKGLKATSQEESRSATPNVSSTRGALYAPAIGAHDSSTFAATAAVPVQRSVLPPLESGLPRATLGTVHVNQWCKSPCEIPSDMFPYCSDPGQADNLKVICRTSHCHR